MMTLMTLFLKVKVLQIHLQEKTVMNPKVMMEKIVVMMEETQMETAMMEEDKHNKSYLISYLLTMIVLFLTEER
jgi:hypothetical protein